MKQIRIFRHTSHLLESTPQSLSLTSSNTLLKLHHAASPSFHPFISSLQPHLRLAAAALTSRNNRHRLFFPLLNNLYSHRKMQANVPKTLLKCQPHREIPSEEGRGREGGGYWAHFQHQRLHQGGNELFVVNGRVNLLVGSHKGTTVYNMLQICYSISATVIHVTTGLV